MRSRAPAVLFSLAAVVVLSAFTPPDPAPARDPAITVASAPPRMSAIAAPGDTFRIVAAWPAVVDGQAVPPSYVVAWRYHKYPVSTAFPTSGPTKTITATADSLSLAMPAFPDSMWVEVRVTATRGGYSAATTSATRFFRRTNPTPPPVTTVTLDTASTP